MLVSATAPRSLGGLAGRREANTVMTPGEHDHTSADRHETRQPARRLRAIACAMLCLLAGCMCTARSAFAQSGPGDVLTPNAPSGGPTPRIGVRASLIRTAYTNDRYLDNIPFDVGNISGETEVYSSAAGMGYGAGLDFEYPLNTSFSLLGTLEYQHAAFSSNGAVNEPCVQPNGEPAIGQSIHTFDCSVDLVKISAAARIDFTRWYMLGGLAASHPVATSLNRVRSLGGDCVFPGTQSRTIEEHGPIPVPARIHYALRVGAGLVYRLGSRLSFCPELTLDFGSNSINKSPDADLGVYALSATLRYDLR